MVFVLSGFVVILIARLTRQRVENTNQVTSLKDMKQGVDVSIRCGARVFRTTLEWSIFSSVCVLDHFVCPIERVCGVTQIQ